MPKPFIVARYFAKEQAALDRLQEEIDTVTAEITELREEHGQEGGVLHEVTSRAAADTAQRQALLDLWADDDPTAFRNHTQLREQAEADTAGAELETESPYFDPLRGRPASSPPPP